MHGFDPFVGEGVKTEAPLPCSGALVDASTLSGGKAGVVPGSVSWHAPLHGGIPDLSWVIRVLQRARRQQHVPSEVVGLLGEAIHSLAFVEGLRRVAARAGCERSEQPPESALTLSI